MVSFVCTHTFGLKNLWKRLARTKKGFSAWCVNVAGRDWMWGNQDGEPHSLGTIVGRHADGMFLQREGNYDLLYCFLSEWVDVVWDNGEGHTYRMGADGKFDLHILTVRELASVMDSTSGSARTLASPVTAGGYSFVVSGANRTSHVVEPTVSTRGSRPVHSRATSSTLSLPETSANFGSSAGGSSQAVSSDQLHRAVEVRGFLSNRKIGVPTLSFRRFCL